MLDGILRRAGLVEANVNLRPFCYSCAFSPFVLVAGCAASISSSAMIFVLWKPIWSVLVRSPRKLRTRSQALMQWMVLERGVKTG